MKRKYNWFAVPVNRKVVVVYLVLFGLCAISAVLSPSFRTLVNFKHLLFQITPLIVVGVAQTLVILSGGIDLSIGSIVSLANVAAVQVWRGFGASSFIIIPLLLGAAAGGVNGVLVGERNVPPIIVTLATSSIFWGLALLWMPIPGGMAHPGLAVLLAGESLISFFISVGLVVGITLLLRYTEFGRGIYIVGSGEGVARLLGLRVPRVKILVYTLAGVIASFAGIYMAARMYSGDPTLGQPYVLDSIAIAVIGGTSIVGGEGGVLGVIGAAFIFNMLNNILNMLSISTFYQFVVKGIIVIVAVAITQGSILLRGEGRIIP
jgi:ribose transport system permease protein